MFSVNGHLASTPETYGETESIVVERRFSPCCDFEEEGERRFLTPLQGYSQSDLSLHTRPHLSKDLIAHLDGDQGLVFYGL
jgi:hypothetical protein